MPLIDMRPDHWAIVRGILEACVPDREVWAFGSRAIWTAKAYSDLDLAVISEKPLSGAVSAALDDALSESDLPYRVDVVDWATTSAGFREIIMRSKVVVQRGKKAAPGPSEQRAISHLFGILNERIELNRRMSNTLEAMASALRVFEFVDVVCASASALAPPFESVQEQRRFEQVCKAVARALVPADRKARLRRSKDFKHLTTRLSTFLILIDESIDALARDPSRSHALSLILAADIVWQVMCEFGNKKGDYIKWIDAALPADREKSDADIGDGHYAKQREIVSEAKWVFDLHSALRHPGTSSSALLPLMRDPVDPAACDRLVRAARSIRQVFVNVSVDLDPTVWCGSESPAPLLPG